MDWGRLVCGNPFPWQWTNLRRRPEQLQIGPAIETASAPKAEPRVDQCSFVGSVVVADRRFVEQLNPRSGLLFDLGHRLRHERIGLLTF